MILKNKNKAQANTRRSNKKEKSKLIWWFMLPLMILILAAAVYSAKLYATAQKAVDLSYHNLQRENAITVNPLKETTSILLMGIDDNENRNLGSARADSLIYLTIDPTKHVVNMVSIPRDTYTNIIYQEQIFAKEKINAAYSKGEEQATIESVENLLDVPIHYYATFNFDAFLEIIDALDGIEVNVPITFSEQNAQGTLDQIHLQKGLQTLNGEEALALARTRKIDNDIKRGERQQLLIQAIVNKALRVGSITKYSDAITAVGKNMRTDIRFSDMLGIAQTGLDGKYAFESYVFDWTDFNLDGASMVEVYPDSLDFISHRLRVSLGLNTPDERDESDYTFQTNGLSNYSSDY
jgi:LCP family protein required for cell wall assembly